MAGRNYEQEIADLKQEVRSLTRQLKSTGASVSREVGDTAEDYWRDAKDYYDKVADMSREKWDELKHETRTKGKEIDKYARENPWHAAGIAAAAGFLAAMMFRKRD